MASRSIASLSLTFGLVSIPVKVFSATESSAAVRFKLMSSGGARVRQQYVADIPPTAQDKDEEPAKEEPAPEEERSVEKVHAGAPKVVGFPTARVVPPPPSMPSMAESVIERSTMVKGYEYEKGKFVLFTPEELTALEAASRKTIDILSFIPENAIDPIYYHKAYFLAPDKGGVKPYSLLLRAMHDTGRCAVAKWAFRSKEYVAQIRAADDGMVLQQLFYADEVRSLADLHIERTEVGAAELALAMQLIRQIAADSYDPGQFVDEEKQRILAAVAEKVAGKQVRAPARASGPGGQVVNLLEALRASLQAKQGVDGTTKDSGLERKPVKRATRKASRLPAASTRPRSSKR